MTRQRRFFGILMLIAAPVVILTACGSATTAPKAGHAASVARYSSAQQVVAALGRAGMACTGGASNAPVVSGAQGPGKVNVTVGDWWGSDGGHVT
jgi:hypothetical protein